MSRRHILTALAGLIVIAFAFVGCKAGGSIDYADATSEGPDTPVEASPSVPFVLSMDKTSGGASTSSISIFLTMNEVLAQAPSVSSVIVPEGSSSSLDVSKAAGSTECSLIEDGSRVECRITVASCRTTVDYQVTISGGANADGGVMEDYVYNVNAADAEFGSEANTLDCFTQFSGDDGDLGDYGEIVVRNGALQFEMTDCLVDEEGEPVQDLAQVSLERNFLGHADTAVTIKAEGSFLPGASCAGSSLGIQMNPLASIGSPSEGYRVIYNGIIMTTYADDGLGTFYEPTDIDVLNGSEYYYCIVKKGADFSYFLSTDGLNYTQLTADTAVLSDLFYDGETPPYVTPIDAGWECPDPPGSVCNSDYGWPSNDDYIRCMEEAEAIFSEETCSAFDFDGDGNLLYLYPTVRIFGTAAVGSESPEIHWVRWKVAGVEGTVDDCATIY